jgi:hypothetical protein
MKQELPRQAEIAKIRGHVSALATRGRNTKFINRKKQDNRNGCRNKNLWG